MPDNKAKLALHDLVASQQEEIDAILESAAQAAEGTAPAEAPAPAEVAAPSATGAVAEVVTETPAPEGEAPTGTPAPGEYFGVDLSDIPEEARQPFIDELKERDTLINRLLRERAEAEANPPTPAAPAEPANEEPVTDEDILRMLGQDPELVDPTAAEALVRLGRKLVETDAKVAQMAEQSAVQETQFYWESSLDKLEAQFGALPVPREGEGGLYQYAIKNVINDPALAYWAIVGPTRAEVTTEVKKRREATAEAKRAAATLRPGSNTDLAAAPLVAKTNKAATKEAAEQVLKGLGLM